MSFAELKHSCHVGEVTSRHAGRSYRQVQPALAQLPIAPCWLWAPAKVILCFTLHKHELLVSQKPVAMRCFIIEQIHNRCTSCQAAAQCCFATPSLDPRYPAASHAQDNCNDKSQCYTPPRFPASSACLCKCTIQAAMVHSETLQALCHPHLPDVYQDLCHITEAQATS